MMFRVSIAFHNIKPEDITVQQVAMIKQLFPKRGSSIEEWHTGKYKWASIDDEVADMDDVESIGLPDDAVTYKPMPRLTLPQKIHDVLNSKECGETRALAPRMVQIHLPGHDLPAMMCVTNLDNVCTNEVDEYLKQGWRILAILPQPNNRRPDYILGRTSREN